jgi:AraC-like DNA-binding protein
MESEMTAWAQQMQLTAGDAVFTGPDVALMRTLIADETTDAHGGPGLSLMDQARIAADAAGPALIDRVSQPLGRYGQAGSAILTSSTLRVALASMNTIAPLLNLRHELVLASCSGDGVVLFRPFSGIDAAARDALLPLDAAKVALFLVQLLDGTDRTVRLVAPPRWITSFAQSLILADRVELIEGDMFEIRIPGPSATMPLPGRCVAGHARWMRACIRTIRDMVEDRLLESVRRLVNTATDDAPSLSDVAARLHLSARTLRRRLADRGVSFMRIVDEERRSLALQYVMGGEMTVESIAERLGYSESANFRHAFRRWTGSSPRNYLASSQMLEAVRA